MIIYPSHPYGGHSFVRVTYTDSGLSSQKARMWVSFTHTRPDFVPVTALLYNESV